MVLFQRSEVPQTSQKPGSGVSQTATLFSKLLTSSATAVLQSQEQTSSAEKVAVGSTSEPVTVAEPKEASTSTVSVAIITATYSDIQTIELETLPVTSEASEATSTAQPETATFASGTERTTTAGND